MSTVSRKDATLLMLALEDLKLLRSANLCYNNNVSNMEVTYLLKLVKGESL